IVIGFAMTAFVVVLSLRSIGEVRTDHVDGQEPRK
ncbi:Na+/H+ antiporter subunit C, partial [Klebsiella pneumoniae]|nr:Na+/H+ antiporter subunit C [Klebsiella pneumoniae]